MQGHLPPPRVRVVAVGCVRRVGAHRPKHIHWLDYSVTLHVAPAAPGRPAAGARWSSTPLRSALCHRRCISRRKTRAALVDVDVDVDADTRERDFADAEPLLLGLHMVGAC